MPVQAGVQRGVILRYVIVAGIFVLYGIWCVKDGWYNEVYANDLFTLYFNRAMAFVCPIAALGMLVRAYVLSRETLIADDDGLHSGKRHMKWSDVTTVDTKDFDKKGILRLNYVQQGAARTWVLDEFRLTRFDQLLAVVEAKLADKLPADRPSSTPQPQNPSA